MKIERVWIKVNGTPMQIQRRDLPAIKELQSRMSKQQTLIGRIKWALGIK